MLLLQVAGQHAHQHVPSKRGRWGATESPPPKQTDGIDIEMHDTLQFASQIHSRRRKRRRLR